MTADLKSSLRFAYRMNIERYRRLLATKLDDRERQLVEQRLAEEQQALGRIPSGDGDIELRLD